VRETEGDENAAALRRRPAAALRGDCAGARETQRGGFL